MKNTSLKSIFVVGGLTVLSKLAAILRQIILTYFYGATNVSDAYILSQSIPNTMFALVISAIGISYIPVYSKAVEEDGNVKADAFTSRLMNSVVIIASVVVAITVLFAEQIVFIFASGFEEEHRQLTANFLKISIFSVYFIGTTGILASYLKAKQRFFSSSIIGVALNVVEIVALFISAKTADIVLAWGVVFAAAAQFCIVFFAAAKNGFGWSLKSGFRDQYVNTIIKLSIPIFISYGIDEINVIIDKTIASQFASGSISALNYSNTIIMMINSIITVSMYTVLFSEVSKLATTNDIKKITEKIQKSIEMVLVLLVPATVGICIYSKDIISLMFERGNFDHNATLITASTLVFYSLSLVANGIRMLSQTYFYSYGKTRFCMYVGIGAVLVNIVLNLALSEFIGINGLALASSIAVVFAAVIHLARFIRECKEFQWKSFLKIIVLAVFNSLAMGVTSWLIYEFLVGEIGQVFALVVALVVAVVVYFALSIVSGVINRNSIKMFLRRKT